MGAYLFIELGPSRASYGLAGSHITTLKLDAIMIMPTGLMGKTLRIKRGLHSPFKVIPVCSKTAIGPIGLASCVILGNLPSF